MIFTLVMMTLTGMVLATALLWKTDRPMCRRMTTSPVVASLNIPLGAGVLSCVSFLLLQLGALPGVSGVWLQIIVLVIAAGLCAPAIFGFLRHIVPKAIDYYKLRRKQLTEMPQRTKALLFIATLAQVGTMIAALDAYTRAPMGQYDAWAIWNLRAHFMYVAGGDWRLAFDPAMGWSHTDYPLLLPLTVWNGWHTMGAQSIHWPAIVGIAFAASTVLALFSFSAVVTGTARAALVVVYLLTLPFVADMATWQYADYPLACYMLAALGATALAWRQTKPGVAIFFLAAMLAGFAAFTKNEGLVFAGALTLSVGVGLAMRRQWRRIGAWLAGLTPGLLCVVIQKLTLAATNDLVSGAQHRSAALLMDGERHRIILQRAVDIVPDAVQPLLLLTLIIALLLAPGRIGLRRPSVLLVTGFPLLTMLLAYEAAYLVAPQDLAMYLNTSLDRLVLQWLPMALLWLAMFTRWLGAKGYGLGLRRGGDAIGTG